MNSVICKVLKGLFITGWFCTVGPDATLGSTKYVDAGCPTNGNGCASGGCIVGGIMPCGGTNGPFNSIDNAISAMSNGDVIEIRGAHPQHGTCPGTTCCAASFNTTGVHQTDRYMVRSKNNITFQAYHYGLGDQEKPIIEGAGTVTWTQCTDCSASSSATACQNAPGLCTDLWWYSNTSEGKKKGLWAVTNTGRMTYRVAAKADISNSHAGYITTSCSGYSWIACNVDRDCPTNSTCNGPVTTPIDSFSSVTDSSGSGTGYILVKWGSATKGPVAFDNNGYGFDVASSSNITIQGLHFRNHRRSAYVNTNDPSGTGVPPTNITFQNNTVVNTGDVNGSGYGVSFSETTPISIKDNYFAYTQDESIHSRSDMVPATVMTITGNFIRDTGAAGVLGVHPAHCANDTTRTCLFGSDCTAGNCVGFDGSTGTLSNYTPEAMTLGSSAGANGGNYSDSTISNNYILRTGKQGIIIEDDMHGTSGHPVTFSNNIINTTARSGFKLACEASTGSTSLTYLDLYNNILVGVNSKSQDAAFNVSFSGSCSLNNVNIYNNTVSMTTSGGAVNYPNSAAGTNVVIRNNIFSTGTRLAVNSDEADASNLLQYNLIYTTANPAVKWLNANRACNALSSAGTGNIDGPDAATCRNPNFVNVGANDFHLSSATTNSLAVDAGTTSLAARTTSINNTVFEQYSSPSIDYSEAAPPSGGVDIGATEGMVKDGGFESGAFGNGWTNTGALGTVVNTQKRSGTYSVQISNYDYTILVFPNLTLGVDQTFTNLTVGTVYRLDFFAMATDATIFSGGNFLFVVQDPASSSNTYCDTTYYAGILPDHGPFPGTVCDLAGNNSFNVGGWQPITVLFKAENATTTIHFHNVGPIAANIWIDDITVRPN